MAYRPQVGDTVKVIRTNWELEVTSVSEECGYTFVTLEGRGGTYRLEDIEPLRISKRQPNENQYEYMSATLKTRLEIVEGQREDFEDKLRKLEEEEEYLNRAIEALEELRDL